MKAAKLAKVPKIFKYIFKLFKIIYENQLKIVP